MKFSCEKFLLQNAVNSAIKAISNKTTIPALQCLLITANEDITITGFDLSMGIKSNFEANIFEKGSYLLNAKLLSEIIRKLPNEEVTISINSDFKVKIVCGKAIFDLNSFSADEYPEIPAVQKLDFLQLNSKTLKEIIAQTKFARSDNESKLIHTGFLFEIGENELTVVAVDGFKLALKRTQITNNTLKNTSFVVPGNALVELDKLLNEEDVQIYIDSKHILFEINNIVLTVRLIDGEFLDYKKSIPNDFSTNIICNIAELKSTIDRVSLIISEQIKTPIRFSFENNILKLSCITTVGKSYDEFEFEGETEDFEIGFNHKYIVETLSACPHNDAKISFKGHLSPVVISPKEDTNEFLYLILPVRLKAND